jgi:hypothetical protein
MEDLESALDAMAVYRLFALAALVVPVASIATSK